MLFLVGKIALAEIDVARLDLGEELWWGLYAAIGAPIDLLRVAGEHLRVTADAIALDDFLAGGGLAGGERRRLCLRERGAGSQKDEERHRGSDCARRREGGHRADSAYAPSRRATRSAAGGCESWNAE